MNDFFNRMTIAALPKNKFEGFLWDVYWETYQLLKTLFVRIPYDAVTGKKFPQSKLEKQLEDSYYANHPEEYEEKLEREEIAKNKSTTEKVLINLCVLGSWAFMAYEIYFYLTVKSYWMPF